MRRRIGILLTVLALRAAAAHAGVTSLALDTGWDHGASGPRPFGGWVGPSLDVEAARASLILDGRFGGALPAADRAGRLRLATMLRERGALRPELVLQGATGQEGTAVREGVRLHLAGSRGGAWIMAAAEAASSGGQGPSLRLPLLGFGAWARSHRLMLAGAVEQHSGVLRVAHRDAPAQPDTGRGTAVDPSLGALRFDPEQVMLSTAYASVRWDGDRFEVESVGGITVGALTAPRRWAQSTVAWRISSQLALVAAAGSRSPQYFAIDPVGERRAALSVRFSQATSAASRPTIAARAEAIDCRLRSMGEGLWRLEVRAPGARVVELQSDATGWQPMTLRPAGGGRWEVEVPLSPGIHQLGLRVDGGDWVPPPGFPTAPDGFGGSVGVAVIE